MTFKHEGDNLYQLGDLFYISETTAELFTKTWMKHCNVLNITNKNDFYLDVKKRKTSERKTVPLYVSSSGTLKSLAKTRCYVHYYSDQC